MEVGFCCLLFSKIQLSLGPVYLIFLAPSTFFSANGASWTEPQDAIQICSSSVQKIFAVLRPDLLIIKIVLYSVTAMNNFFNPTIELDNKQDDLEITEEYLFKLGFDGCREELELVLAYLDSLVKNGNKCVAKSKDVASLHPASSEVASRFSVAPVSTIPISQSFW